MVNKMPLFDGNQAYVKNLFRGAAELEVVDRLHKTWEWESLELIATCGLLAPTSAPVCQFRGIAVLGVKKWRISRGNAPAFRSDSSGTKTSFKISAAEAHLHEHSQWLSLC